MTLTAGLDVGGAHLKVARMEAGTITAVEEIVCPLWQGLDKLDAAFDRAGSLLEGARGFGVTMTGELSDLFPDRATGVATLVGRLAEKLGPSVSYWTGEGRFVTADEVSSRSSDVGSLNFLATAEVVAGAERDALLIDFGSTTVDIIPIKAGRPIPRGRTDRERQVTGELVYTGLTRTAVMGVAERAPLKGQWVTLAREYLATMADVRRVLGELPEGVDRHATADGRGKSLGESTTRLARMLGADAAEASLSEWAVAALYVREMQLRSIHDGALQVLSAADLPAGAPVVTAGIGADAAAILALRLGRGSVAFGELAGVGDALMAAATHAAPAVAVALLHHRWTGR